MTTGGFSAENPAEFPALPCVLAYGGGRLTPEAVVATGDFEQVTQNLLNLLAKIPELRVISRTSAFSFMACGQRSCTILGE